MSLTAGFAGLGRMGRPMALAVHRAGFPLQVWNRTASTAHAFAAETGCQAAVHPSDLAASCDVLITMLADDVALQAFYVGPQGALAGLRTGHLVIDMSTVSPQASAALGRQIHDAGGQFVDAPVSGSTTAAEARTLLVMAGGEDSTVAAVRPVLTAMASKVIHVGGPGSGIIMKLAVNTIVYGINQAVAEGLVLAERAGIDRVSAYDVFCESAVAAPVVRYRRDFFVQPGNIAPSFLLDLAVKDMRLIAALAEKVGSRIPQASVNLAELRDASSAGYGDWDMSAVAEYLRGRPKEEFGSSPGRAK